MTVIDVPYSENFAFAAGPVAENFRISANRGGKSPERYLSDEEVIETARQLLRKPKYKRTFLIGAFTNKIDPKLGRLGDGYIELIESVHRYYEERDIECHSSFKREEYSRLGIRDGDATALDKLAILTSHVLTVLPGSSESNGTWAEICYGGAYRKSFLFLFRKSEPELKFRGTLRRLIANLTTHSYLILLTFNNLTDLYKQADSLWSPIKQRETSNNDWEMVMQEVAGDPATKPFLKYVFKT